MSTETFQLAAELGAELRKRNQWLVTAESCTGGGIAHAITDIPGSSQWFDCGFVTYSNASKSKMLNVPESLIHQHGAVSGEIAAAMAKGALAVTNGTIAIAATGIAGPDGGTATKPVGTVWFGLAGNNRVYTEQQFFSGNRQAVRNQSVRHALIILLQFLRSA
ncbi:MAG: CinA family protein [Betaproteobacteria bacterium]|nr:CinA family protein [Betaproteobacteria bacterium]